MELVELGGLAQMDTEEAEVIKNLVAAFFGNFDERVQIEGIYFAEERAPFTVYLFPRDRFLVAICLPRHQADNPLARLIHLAHELVHCLNPNGLPPYQATVLEEGLAEHAKVYLGREIYQGEYPDYDFRDLSTGKYREAFNIIERVIEFEGLEEMRMAVRTLRRDLGQPFARILEESLSAYFPNTPLDLISSLSENFRSWEGNEGEQVEI
ncbi:hypothetical protein [Rhizobium leguminosarum]|uniref:hypothetical protein n=1 Tax=Rhizobium leguminosarum TaxID=384 RepID=UPI001C8FCE7D|nr:hypothetical protein [Rhizobium leguminosarum]MBY2914667.1 hypothetical protein [Rhizobium leguminosarum]MBY2970206.1 hypothetical protein [Rhizobium leguminosarum]MBY2977579.1 hypothetical protein [Rhizobium leguminosarum]MBY2999175.1 hypothetical protein [Rhizobium leguminosarum]MBY3006129.1 hypothetical protein [Rhizobium leguminosarum]